MTETKQIDFKFSKNWKKFDAWFSKQSIGEVADWDVQKKKIQELYESTVPKLIDWAQLWKDYDLWVEKINKEDFEKHTWKAEMREIETQLLNQISDLSKEMFILVFLNKTLPDMHPQLMTYWEADRIKVSLEGNSNGEGGDEDIDCATIVNIKNLIKR